MNTEGCARGVVLLLLVSNSFSQSFDDTSKTLDASQDDPAWTSVKHHPLGVVGGRLRRWNAAPENSVELQNATTIGDEQRFDEGGHEGVNATSDVKESKHGFLSYLYPHGQYRPHYVFQVAATTAAPAITPPISGVCQLLAANAGITAPTALQTYLQQCASLLGLISAPMTTAAPTITPPIAGVCQLLAANAGITAPAALQTYLQQCASLLGLISAPTTTAPMTTAAPTITPPISGICQLLASNAGITAPAALQTYLQQCASLLGLISTPTTTAPTTTATPTITPPIAGVCQLLAANAGITAPAALQTYLQQCASLLGLISAPTTTAPTTTATPTITPPIAGVCQLLAANAGITAPAALQTYLQQCASLLGLISAPTTTAPTTTATPTITPPITGVCQLLAANAGITAPAALQSYLQQCAVLLGLVNG